MSGSKLCMKIASHLYKFCGKGKKHWRGNVIFQRLNIWIESVFGTCKDVFCDIVFNDTAEMNLFLIIFVIHDCFSTNSDYHDTCRRNVTPSRATLIKLKNVNNLVFGWLICSFTFNTRKQNADYVHRVQIDLFLSNVEITTWSREDHHSHM